MQTVPIPQNRPPTTMTVPVTTGDALEALFATHYRELVRLVSGLLDDNESCEEAVQDAFASMLRRDRPLPSGKEAAYLRSAALNSARSQLRKRRVRRRHLEAVAPPTEAAEAAALNRLESRRILETIRTLPRRQSEALLLRFQADLSELEIAETLGISPGSVKTHASRGLAAIRARLQERS